MDCVFCTIIRTNSPPHEIVWEDRDHIAFLSAFPAQLGHTLVVPRAHAEYAFDLPQEQFAALVEAARRLAIPLKPEMGAVRIELGIAGYEVPHIHVHLIPSHHGPDMCHPARLTIPEEKMREIGGRLRAAFADVPPVAG